MNDSHPTRTRIMDAAQNLVLKQGFSATTVDAVIESAGVSKGAFFHHFASKQALGQSMLERYAATDAQILDAFMSRAEAESDDPAEQVLAFVRYFEENAGEMFADPGCLFVSFVYEKLPHTRESDDVIRANIEMWRGRLGAKIAEALRSRSPDQQVDTEAVADLMFTVFEGAFILARATGDPGDVGRQLGQYRTYLGLLLGQRRPEDLPSAKV